MLSWLVNTVGGWLGSVGSAVVNFVRSVVGGVVGLLDFIFGRVGSAWDDLVTAVKTLAGVVHEYTVSVWQVLHRIMTYYIPVFAMTAWWWVTNPDALAQVLLWHLLKWLEAWAWTVAQYLGEFILALLVRNLRRIALLVETIVAAVL